MLKLGYSLGGSNSNYSLKEKIKLLLSFEKKAVELSYIIADRFKEKLDAEDIKKLREFKYVSIHAPAKYSEGNKKWVRYPGKDGTAIVEKLLYIAEKINANTILFHPDLVDDFKWLDNRVGDLLSFENMDDRKSFGSNVADMEQVFSQASHAKWVCDINHIYTVDHSMKLSEDFHQAFAKKLCHYHISGYGGWHDAFHISQEDIILQGIKDFSVPLINEGNILRDGLKSLKKEDQYLRQRLK